MMTNKLNFPTNRVFGVFQVTSPLFLIRDPKLVKQLAVKDFDHFVDHRSFIDKNQDKLLARSLVNLQGQEWRGLVFLMKFYILSLSFINYWLLIWLDMRATLSPMFTGSKMRQMYSHVASVGQQTSKTMRENILRGEENLVEFKELAMKFTVDVRM